MDEIGEHAWIISIVGDFLTLLLDSPCSIACPRAVGAGFQIVTKLIEEFFS